MTLFLLRVPNSPSLTREECEEAGCDWDNGEVNFDHVVVACHKNELKCVIEDNLNVISAADQGDGSWVLTGCDELAMGADVVFRDDHRIVITVEVLEGEKLHSFFSHPRSCGKTLPTYCF